MNKSTNTPAIVNASSILSALSPEAQAVLASHFRAEIVQQISGTLSPESTVSTVKAAAKSAPAKRPEGTVAGVGRARAQFTNDGTNRSASQFIRDTDAAFPGISAKDVVAKAAEVGLSIEAPLVYNVRQLVRNKANEAAEKDAAAVQAKSEADKAADTQALKAAALEKARAAKAEKRNVAVAEANAKTAGMVSTNTEAQEIHAGQVQVEEIKAAEAKEVAAKVKKPSKKAAAVEAK